MVSRLALWQTLAGSVSLLVAAVAFAQTTNPPPKAPAAPAVNSGPTGSVPIIPVSLKSDSVAATVNGEKILVGDVKKVLDVRPYPLSLTEEQKKHLRQAALDVLVEDCLMRQYLNKNSAQVSQAAFNKEVEDFKNALKKENKTLDMFLKESGQTQEILSRDIVARLQWRSLLLRWYPDDKAKVYYDTNKVFFDKVFVRASHILVKLPANASKEQRDKAVQQLLVWRQEIVTGKSKFEDIAKKYSDCPTKDAMDKNKVPTPGDIGQFPYKFIVVPEFAKAAFALKIGEVSDVVITVFGAHLIKATERTAGEPSSFEPLKESVREVMAQDDDLYQRVLTEQRKQGQIKIDLP